MRNHQLSLLLGPVLAALIIAGLSASTARAAFTILSDARVVSGDGRVNLPSDALTERSEEKLAPVGADFLASVFADEFVGRTQSHFGSFVYSANQSSRIRRASPKVTLVASGGGSAEAGAGTQDTGAAARARSLVDLVFHVDELTQIDLSGVLRANFAGDGVNRVGHARVELRGQDLSYVSESAFVTSIDEFLPPKAVEQEFDHSFLIPAGDYHLEAFGLGDATSGTYGGNATLGRAGGSFELSFTATTIPLPPAAWPAVGMLGAIAAYRVVRRRRARGLCVG